MNTLQSRSVVVLLLWCSVLLTPTRATAQLATTSTSGGALDQLPIPDMTAYCAALYEEATRLYGVDKRFIEARRERESAANARAALLHLLRSAAADNGDGEPADEDELASDATALIRDAKQSVYRLSPVATDAAANRFWAEVRACDESNVLRQLIEATRNAAQPATPAAPAARASR